MAASWSVCIFSPWSAGNLFTALSAHDRQHQQQPPVDYVVVDGLSLASHASSNQYAFDSGAHERCVVMWCVCERGGFTASSHTTRRHSEHWGCSWARYPRSQSPLQMPTFRFTSGIQAEIKRRKPPRKRSRGSQKGEREVPITDSQTQQTHTHAPQTHTHAPPYTMQGW